VEDALKHLVFDKSAIHFFGGDEYSFAEAKVTRVNMAYVNGRMVEDGTVPVVFWPSYNSLQSFGLVLGYIDDVSKTGPVGRRLHRKLDSVSYRWLLLLGYKGPEGKPVLYVRDTEDEPVFNPSTRRFEFHNTLMSILDLRGEKANILCDRPELKYVREHQLVEEMERWADT
jgi:hypothetical protein